MSRANTSSRGARKSTQEFPRKPSLSVHPMKIAQPKVSKIMARDLSPLLEMGDVITGQLVMSNSQLWNDIPALAATLVEHVSLHFLPRVTPPHSEHDNAVMDAVLRYLSDKEATPRRLGAFSFLVSRGTPMYLENGTHFAYDHLDYMGVYASFGGDMKAPISRPKGSSAVTLRLSSVSQIPARNIRPQQFSKDILSLVDEGIAFYDMPVPLGADFSDMRPGTLAEYISAGIGPRMLFDFSGKVTDAILDEVMARCWKASIIAPYIHLFDQIKPHLSYTDLDFPYTNDMAVLTGDSLLLDAIEQYGESFRLAYLSMPQLAQVLGMPFGVALSEGVRNVLVRKLITGDDSHSEKFISPFALASRASAVTNKYIEQQKELMELSLGASCVVQYHLTDPESLYSCSDIFTYCTVSGEGCTLHVVSSDQLRELSVGHGVDLDDAIEWDAIERWNYMEDNDLFPAVDIRDMLRAVTHPSTDLAEVLNRVR